MTDTNLILSELEISEPAPILVKNDDTDQYEVSYSNLHHELNILIKKKSSAARLQAVVHMADVVNHHAISAIYTEMKEIHSENYDAYHDLGSAWWNLMEGMPEHADEKAFGDVDQACSMASSLACAAHMFLHKKYDNARYGDRKGVPINLVGQVVRFELMYQDLLRTSQRAAKSLDDQMLRDIYEEISFEVYGEYAWLVEQVGALSWEDRGFKSIGLRVCQLSRKMAFLMASTLYLRARMVTKSSRNGLTKIATTRTKLLRRIPNVQMNWRALSRIKDYTRLTICTYINDIQWIDSAVKPYSFASSISEDYFVRLYYKSMARSGMSSKIWVWTKGKKETKEGMPVVVAEFEGLGQHQDEYWEDYLATKMNDYYNLYPGSLHMEWEFPVIGSIGAINDLIARIKK